MELALGIDLGTSHFKACLVERSGAQRGLGRVAVRTDTGDGRLCELPADRFWAYLREAVGQALRQAGAASRDVRTLSYASQANSFLLLDGRDVPLTPLWLWPDERVTQVDPAVEALWTRPDFLQTTGLGVGPGPGFAVAKVRWIQRHLPHEWSRARRVLTISDYLTYSLTGQPVGDAGTASLLGILDLQQLAWWPAALEALEIDAGRLARPLRPGTLAGAVTEEGANRMGIATGIPLAVGGLDHYVAALGAGLGRLADVSASIGTVTACLRHTDSLRPLPNGSCGPGLGSNYSAGGQVGRQERKRGRDALATQGQDALATYCQLAFDDNGAEVLAWYQRRHAPELTIPQLLDLARDVPDGEDTPAALPHADRHKGLEGFRDCRPSHHHGHYIRAILDSTADTLGALIGTLCPTGRPARIVATGGGARSDFWLQTCADRLRTDLLAVECEEPACLGAAMIAAVAAGWFGDCRQAAASWVQPRKAFSPR